MSSRVWIAPVQLRLSFLCFLQKYSQVTLRTNQPTIAWWYFAINVQNTDPSCNCLILPLCIISQIVHPCRLNIVFMKYLFNSNLQYIVWNCILYPRDSVTRHTTLLNNGELCLSIETLRAPRAMLTSRYQAGDEVTVSPPRASQLPPCIGDWLTGTGTTTSQQRR